MGNKGNSAVNGLFLRALLLGSEIFPYGGSFKGIVFVSTCIVIVMRKELGFNKEKFIFYANFALF